MTLDKETLETLTKLETASRRTQPYIVIGLLAIALGFLSISIYLESERRLADERSKVLNEKVQSLTATLSYAQSLLARRQVSGSQSQEIRGALASAASQAQDLQTIGMATSSEPTPILGPNDPIRLYIQISTEDQRESAQMFANAISKQQLGGHKIVVPGIDLAATKGGSTVRCLKVQDCKYIGELASLIATIVNEPIKTLDLSSQYDAALGVRPGTFEIWFASGTIVLKR